MSKPVTMPSLEQLDAAGFHRATPRYPPVTIDGVPYRGLCDAIIDLVPEWVRRRKAVKALCRHAEMATAQEAVAADARARLTATDHWALKASEAGEALAPKRRAYREALREIARSPAGFSAWPVKPE